MNLKRLSLMFFVVLMAGITTAQTQWIPVNPDDESFAESCTSIMVGKKASTDGSVMTSHTCDANYRTYVTIEPRKSFTVSDTEPVYAGLLHNEEPWDMRNVVEKGRIPVHDTITYR